jgi:hypothetical protein
VCDSVQEIDGRWRRDGDQKTLCSRCGLDTVTAGACASDFVRWRTFAVERAARMCASHVNFPSQVSRACQLRFVPGVPPRRSSRAAHVTHARSTDNLPDDQLWEQGLQEARELLVMAIKLAQADTRQALQDAFQSEGSEAPTASEDTEQLVNFWLEQGAPEHLAHLIVKDMRSLPARCRNMSYLAPQVSRLGRLLPTSIPALVARDALVLTTDLNQAVKNMIVLVEAFPGAEVSDIVSRRPRLLYVSTEELRTRIECCSAMLEGCLPAWVKSKTRRKILVENPELLFRLEHHAGKSFGELPVDIQNMVIAATGGNWWATT